MTTDESSILNEKFEKAISKAKFYLPLYILVPAAFWLVFVISVTLLYSSLLNSTGGIAFLSLLTLAAFSLSTTIFARYTQWSPGRLSAEAGALRQKE